MFSRKRRYYWPQKRKYPSAIEWIKKHHSKLPRIDKRTAISSIGSCFAREIKNYLISKDFNYLLGSEYENYFHSEKFFPGDKGASPSSHASVAWERVYNTFTLRNIIDYSLKLKEFPERLLSINSKDGDSYISDILRSRIIYKNKEEAAKDIHNHIQQSHDIFAKSDILIITLGLIEIWQNIENNYVVASHPGNAYKLPSVYKPRLSTIEENIDNLRYSFKQLFRFNNKLKIILTVSPVHMLKTERKDVDVISASCYSKSLLRVVAETAINEFENVFYFPSYEIATVAASLDNIEVYPDNHHVSRVIVDRIMKDFEFST